MLWLAHVVLIEAVFSALSRTRITKDLKDRQLEGSNIASVMQLNVRPAGCKADGMRQGQRCKINAQQMA